jgi:hypothetical protein
MVYRSRFGRLGGFSFISAKMNHSRMFRSNVQFPHFSSNISNVQKGRFYGITCLSVQPQEHKTKNKLRGP